MVRWDVDSTWNNHFVDPNNNKKAEVLVKKIVIKTENAIGNDNEGTVDGVHFTDLGFIRYADFLIDKFVEFGLIDIK